MAEPPFSTGPRSWVPKRVVITRSASEFPYTAEIIRRCEAAGVADIEVLSSDRLTGLRGDSERETYARAKSTLAVVVAPPGARRPQPIPPSADWRIDLAKGCPAHCQYCYLAGSLPGPPVTRVYANVDEILAQVGTHAGLGTVTSRTVERGCEGTTFELSCYTDPLGIEAVTGVLGRAIAEVGTGRFGSDVSLRFTTKFDAVQPLIDLPHGRRTRARFSLNAAAVTERYEAGTARLAARVDALRQMACAGYPVGVTLAPIMPVSGWQDGYGRLLDEVAVAVAGVEDLDLTVELITHRFTPGSREVLSKWYPRSPLDMDPLQRRQKRSKFGGVKFVYPKETMTQMHDWFDVELGRRLPMAKVLYWT